MEVFGITGTNGKTTTSYMLDEILRRCGRRCALIGTVTHRIGEKTYEAVNTTPGRAEFREYIEEAKRQGVDTIITEVSSHSLVQGRLDEVPVSFAAFTNLTHDHMDYHGNMEEYFRAKRKLFDFNTLTSSIINIDDEYGRRIYNELKAEDKHEVMSVSLRDDSADYFAEIVNEEFSGTEFILRTCGEKFRFRIAQPGRYNVYNTVTATALAEQAAAGPDITECAEHISHFKGAPGRFEIIEGSGVICVCDYAHTPDALRNLLVTVRQLRSKDTRTADGKIIVCFGCGGDRDRRKRPEMGRIAAELSDYTVITSDNPRSEKPDEIMKEIEGGFEGISKAFEKEISRREAIKKALALAGAGDIVVVAGKGHETYQITGTEKIHFDDREILREYL